MQGIINEEEKRPDNVGSIAGAAKTNVLAHTKQDNTTKMDRQGERVPTDNPEEVNGNLYE